MKQVILFKVLLRRHGWEMTFFLLVSLGLSGMVFTETGERFWRGLVWLEVGSYLWLLARVSLSRNGFGTFGGWQARPVGRIGYLFAEGLTLLPPLALALLARLALAGEMVGPTPAGWGELARKLILITLASVLVSALCKGVVTGWCRHSVRARPRLAWGLVMGVVTMGIVPVKNWGRIEPFRGGSGDSPLIMMTEELSATEDWRILQARWLLRNRYEVEEDAIWRISLKKGMSSRRDGLQMTISDFRIQGEALLVEWQLSRSEDFSADFPEPYGMAMIVSYPGGYFGASKAVSHQSVSLQIPFFHRKVQRLRTTFYSPLALPENLLSATELSQGAELWVVLPGEVVRPLTMQKSNPVARSGARLRKALAGNEISVELAAFLTASGREAMAEVLAAEPWSEEGWKLVVKPYFLKFAGESERARLLKLLTLNPWMADFFLEKGWGEEAEPILRKHLKEGKTLPKRAVSYLARQRETGMGHALVNQLLRMSGDFDEVALAVRNHPGVDWDEVRREAWRRMETGFGAHHVWRQWGVEMGEKEALRQFLTEAANGKEWERSMLEKWFETEGDVVRQLRENWDGIVFQNGKWTQKPSEKGQTSVER